MSVFSKHLFAALMGAALISSCSRPVAYFQPSHTERFTSAKIETVAPARAAETIQPTEMVAPVAVENTNPVVAAPAASAQLAQAREAVSKVEAYVRNDSKLANNKKLSKRMERMKEVLATTTTKPSMTPNTGVSTKKMSMMQRMVTKRINKDIKNKLSPDHTMAKSALTVGLIIAIIGLILLILNVVPALAVIALVVGLVLVLLDLLNVL